eukprot:6346153-Pyramimonas_sp.AAC.2
MISIVISSVGVTGLAAERACAQHRGLRERPQCRRLQHRVAKAVACVHPQVVGRVRARTPAQRGARVRETVERRRRRRDCYRRQAADHRGDGDGPARAGHGEGGSDGVVPGLSQKGGVCVVLPAHPA